MNIATTLVKADPPVRKRGRSASGSQWDPFIALIVAEDDEGNRPNLNTWFLANPEGEGVSRNQQTAFGNAAKALGWHAETRTEGDNYKRDETTGAVVTETVDGKQVKVVDDEDGVFRYAKLYVCITSTHKEHEAKAEANKAAREAAALAEGGKGEGEPVAETLAAETPETKAQTEGQTTTKAPQTAREKAQAAKAYKG